MTLAAAAALAIMANAQAQIRVNMKVGRPENFNQIDPHKVGLNHMDKTFLQNAYFANAFEAKIGEMAPSHGSDEWTKDFGQDMYREHTMANNELRQLARTESIPLSNDWPAMFANNYHKLSNMHGPAFDAAFRKINLQGHTMVMQACAKEIQFGHDAGARGYATKMLAVARSHQMMVMNQQTMYVHNPTTSGTAAQTIKP